jgi:hypothetical protein
VAVGFIGGNYRHFQQCYIVAFYWWRNKPPTCRKSLVVFII